MGRIFDFETVAEGCLAFRYLDEVQAGFQIAEMQWEVRGSEQAQDRLTQRLAGSFRAKYVDFGECLVNRRKEGDPHDMVPMRMGQKQIDFIRFAMLAANVVTQAPEARASVKNDVGAIGSGQFHTGRIATNQ